MKQDKQTTKKLISAAKAGDVAGLAALIDGGGDIDTRDAEGATLLMLAAAKGKLPAVEWLAARGADLEARDESGWTAAFLAMDKRQDAVFLKLWDLGADLAVIPGFGPDLLQLAAIRGRLDWAEQMLRSPGMDVNRVVNGYTALHLANDLAVVDFLLARGADPHLRPETNQSAFVHAIRRRSADKIARLLPHVNGQVLAGWEGYAALCQAADGDDPELLTALLEMGAPPNPPEVSDEPSENGYTPLTIATRGDKLGMVQALLAHGATINPEGFITTPLLHAVEQIAYECAALLLAKGAKPDVTDFFGNTAVHLAIKAESPRLLVLLMDEGAEVDAEALDAAWMLIVESGRVDLARKLLALAPRIDAPRPRRGLDRMLASRVATCASVDALMDRLLSENGKPLPYDPDSRVGLTPLMLAAESDAPDMLAWLLELDVDVQARSENGSTALIFAAASDVHLPSVQRLLAMGADPRQADLGGWTALFAALRGGAAACAQVLMEAGADPCYVDDEGYTALMAAVRGNCLALIPVLLAAGVDPNAQWDGETALDMARGDDYQEAAALIEQAGGGAGSGSASQAGAEEIDIPRENYFVELVAQLKACMPCLDEAALLATEPPASFTDDDGCRTTLLYWLTEGLSAQALMEYEEWEQYWGDWPDLAMLEGVDCGEYEPDAITEMLDDLVEKGDLDLTEPPPYLEWMNYCLKPSGLRLVSFAYENLYLLCVRDDDAKEYKLAELLAEGGIHLLSPEPLSLEECRARLEGG